MEFLSATTMESWSIQMKILLLALWSDCIYFLRFICCIFNLLQSQVQHKLVSCNSISQWIFFGAALWFFPLPQRVFHVRFSCLVLLYLCNSISQWIFFGAALWFFPLHQRVFHVRFSFLVLLCLCSACWNFFCFRNIAIAWQSLILVHTQILRGLGFFPNIKLLSQQSISI